MQSTHRKSTSTHLSSTPLPRIPDDPPVPLLVPPRVRDVRRAPELLQPHLEPAPPPLGRVLLHVPVVDEPVLLAVDVRPAHLGRVLGPVIVDRPRPLQAAARAAAPLPPRQRHVEEEPVGAAEGTHHDAPEDPHEERAARERQREGGDAAPEREAARRRVEDGDVRGEAGSSPG